MIFNVKFSVLFTITFKTRIVITCLTYLFIPVVGNLNVSFLNSDQLLIYLFVANSSWKGILKLRYMSFFLVSIMIFLVKIMYSRFQSSDGKINIKVKSSFTSEQQDLLHVPLLWAVCRSHLMLPVNAQLSVALPSWSWLLWLFLAGRNPYAFIQSLWRLKVCEEFGSAIVF